MNPKHDLTRRSFMESAAVLGGVALAGRDTPRASANDTGPIAGETEHFWYRLAPAGPYIDSQRGKVMFIKPKV